LPMTKNAAGERMILRYHGNTPAIIKATPRAKEGTAKAIMFALGYGHVNLFRTAAAQQGTEP
jgi:hypothetical protein